MNGLRRGTIHLFSIFGIDLYLHWSWFLVAAFEISDRASRYSSPLWNILEYLALFFIVMLHEYGHALACRQVGGQADRIVLWPLGGVAYVNPPMRPGATLWSIAAGPLVNVALAPILVGLALIARPLGWAQELPNAYAFIRAVAAIDIGLFVFNMLPVYPLDGGKILWSVLWFVMGRARSLMVATVVGFVGAAGLIVLAFASGSAWLGILCAFLLLNCWTGNESGAGIVASRAPPQAPGIRMSLVQVGAFDWRLLGLPEVPEQIRYVRIERLMPRMPRGICNDQMSRLWQQQSHRPMGPRTCLNLPSRR